MTREAEVWRQVQKGKRGKREQEEVRQGRSLLLVYPSTVGPPTDRLGAVPSGYLQRSLVFPAMLCSQIGMEGKGVIGSLNEDGGGLKTESNHFGDDEAEVYRGTCLAHGHSWSLVIPTLLRSLLCLIT